MPIQFLRVASVTLVSIALWPLCALQAHAGASLLVDDATFTPPGHCQVESWVRIHSPGQELTAVPACNFANTEFGIGHSHATTPHSTRSWTPGVKRLLRDFDQHRWGAGVSAGATWQSDTGRWADWSINVPTSFALDPDRNLVLHANLGWTKAEKLPGAMTGGIGLEVALDGAWTLLAETHDQRRGATTTQLGLRRAWGQAGSIDLLVGREGSHDNSWLTLGFNVPFSR